MKARDIYHVLKSIVEPIDTHNDQIIAIAKWIESEFTYNPSKQSGDDRVYLGDLDCGTLTFTECNEINSLEVELKDGSIHIIKGIKESYDEIEALFNSGEEFIVVGVNKMAKIKKN